MASELDRLYKLLTEKTGLIRKRDVRLEKIAADRALEARLQVGLTASGTNADLIVHPINQLAARTRPLHPTKTTAVFEIAEWVYLRNDPIQSIADGWMASTVHRNILQNATLTTWGLGLHREFKPGDSSPVEERWYAIGVFTYDLRPLTTTRVTFPAGSYLGVQLTADGQRVGEKPATLPRDSGASCDVRENGMLHIVNGIWRDYWIKEGAATFTAQPN